MHAHEANIITHAPEYARSPEAIRDGLQHATNALLVNLMQVMAPIFGQDEDNEDRHIDEEEGHDEGEGEGEKNFERGGEDFGAPSA